MHILLVEDNPGDIRLTLVAFEEIERHKQIDVVRDGAEAIDYLHRQGRYVDASRPDIVLLDLNLPKIDGRQVLARMKQDQSLRRIPVVILSTSSAEQDVVRAYDLHANCYITKPVDLDEYISVVKNIEDFWSTTAQLVPE